MDVIIYCEHCDETVTVDITECDVALDTTTEKVEISATCPDCGEPIGASIPMGGPLV